MKSTMIARTLYATFLAAMLGLALVIGCRAQPEITPAPERVELTTQTLSQGTQTIKYTVTAQSGYDATFNFVYPDATTESGVHLDIRPISNTVAAADAGGGAALALFNAWIFPQIVSRWQGQLQAAASAAAAQSLSGILNVQQTVTQ